MKIASTLVALASSASMLLPAVVAAASGLEQLEVDRTAVGVVVVVYQPHLAKVINKTFIIPDAEIKTVEVLRTRLGESPDSYRVVYSEGGSVDPEFILYSEAGGREREVFRELGLALRIPGDGFVYVSGHTNDYFDKTKKFLVRPDGSSEVKQPFYYVGIATTALEELELLESPAASSVVASVAKGEAVTVVLNSGDFYLVRSAGGLVGWVRLRQDGTATQFKDLNYAGD